ncbi:MAG: GerMN domain-containing protein [Spirochaetaceae bacterium]|jgi:spore germination protein GerM|nr:GerMN domain-containing protein [Spirochaetaceae bacterium]
MDIIIRKKSFWIPAAALLAVFLISLVFFLLNNNRYERRVLFFPNDLSRVIKGETRYLPVYDSEEKNITLLVKELILGPEYLQYDISVPEKTRLNTLILNKNVLYLDFSMDIAINESDSFIHFDDIINLIKKTVMFNFKHIHTVNITVDGQIPKSSLNDGRPD